MQTAAFKAAVFVLLWKQIFDSFSNATIAGYASGNVFFIGICLICL